MGFDAVQYYIHGLQLRNGPRTKSNIMKYLQIFRQAKIKKVCGQRYLILKKIDTRRDHGSYSDIKRASHFNDSYIYNPDINTAESEATRRDLESLSGEKCEAVEIEREVINALKDFDLYTYQQIYYCHYIVGEVN